MGIFWWMVGLAKNSGVIVLEAARMPIRSFDSAQ